MALVFLFEFLLLDHFLSNQFARWPVRSPNYFYEVDRVTWLWLWSKPAKAFNCGLVTLLMIGLPWIWVPLTATAGADCASASAWPGECSRCRPKAGN